MHNSVSASVLALRLLLFWKTMRLQAFGLKASALNVHFQSGDSNLIGVYTLNTQVTLANSDLPVDYFSINHMFVSSLELLGDLPITPT